MSTSHGIPFYHHSATKKVIWERPEKTSEQKFGGDAAVQPPAVENVHDQGSSSSTVGTPLDRRNGHSSGHTAIDARPAGRGNTDPVASAYASRQVKRPDGPPMPSRQPSESDRRRPRSPSPRGRDRDFKRHRPDVRDDSPPLSAKLAVRERETELRGTSSSCVPIRCRPRCVAPLSRRGPMCLSK